jgi:hypothetical protein
MNPEDVRIDESLGGIDWDPSLFIIAKVRSDARITSHVKFVQAAVIISLRLD